MHFRAYRLACLFGVESVLRVCLEGESSDDAGSTHNGSKAAHMGMWSSAVRADDTVREGSGSLDGPSEEALTASALHALVQIGLAPEQRGGADTGSVRGVGLELDVGGDDGTRARGAEFGRVQGGFEEEEGGVGGLEGGCVELEDGLDLVVERGEGGGAGGGGGGGTVRSAVVL